MHYEIGESHCFRMVVFQKTHHQLLNSVTFIHKWSMSNIPTYGQPLHHLQLQREDICICKHMLRLSALKMLLAKNRSVGIYANTY